MLQLHMAPSLSFAMGLLKSHTVYGLRREGEYLYIGKTQSLFGRFAGHHIIGPRIEPLPTDTLDVWLCKGAQEASQLEFDLIQEHRPIYNTVGVKSLMPKGAVSEQN